MWPVKTDVKSPLVQPDGGVIPRMYSFKKENVISQVTGKGRPSNPLYLHH